MAGDPGLRRSHRGEGHLKIPDPVLSLTQMKADRVHSNKGGFAWSLL